VTAGPVAVIAGAGAAGQATAAALQSAGYHVVLVDHRLANAERAASAVGGDAEAFEVDLGDVAATTTLRDDLLARLGRVDVVVHLVGGWRGSKSLDATSVENWLALNPPVVGTLAVLTAVFSEDIKAAPRGRAFMVTSTATVRPTVGNIAYAAAKRAAEAWMDGVADFLKDSDSASVVVAVKALLTDAMIADDPSKAWPGYTHVNDLASRIAEATVGDVANGARIDLTIDSQGTA
jgi:NADP-dependent 3-hydroxy acid dehydrogenase YdfG